MEKTETAYCGVCRQQRAFQARRTSKALNIALTVLTAGLWLLVWPLLAMRSTRMRCAVCGSTLRQARAKAAS